MRVKRSLALLLLMALTLGSCSGDELDAPPGGKTTVAVRLDTRAVLDGGLESEVYIYRKESEEKGYVMNRVFSLGKQDTKTIEFEEGELEAGYDYRFFFTAYTPETKEDIAVKGAVVGKEWKDLELEASKVAISNRFFYGTCEMNGSEIAKKKVIDGTLVILVGQSVIDLSMTDGAYDSGATEEDAVWSALDRIYAVEVSCTGVTKSLKFDDDLELIPHSVWEDEDICFISSQSTTIPHQDLFRIPGKKFEESGYAQITGAEQEGGIRIYGYYLLPTSNLRVKILFNYYHTVGMYYPGYPVHTKESHEDNFHTADCFEKQSVGLHLPAQSTETALRIFSGYYTINSALLPCERIIDMPVEVSNEETTFNMVWKYKGGIHQHLKYQWYHGYNFVERTDEYDDIGL